MPEIREEVSTLPEKNERKSRKSVSIQFRHFSEDQLMKNHMNLYFVANNCHHVFHAAVAL